MHVSGYPMSTCVCIYMVQLKGKVQVASGHKLCSSMSLLWGCFELTCFSTVHAFLTKDRMMHVIGFRETPVDMIVSYYCNSRLITTS